MHSSRFSRRSAPGGEHTFAARRHAGKTPEGPPRGSFGTRTMAETKSKAPRCDRWLHGCPRERRCQICSAYTAARRAASRTLPRLRAARAGGAHRWPQPPQMVQAAAGVPAFREPRLGSNPRGRQPSRACGRRSRFRGVGTSSRVWRRPAAPPAGSLPVPGAALPPCGPPLR